MYRVSQVWIKLVTEIGELDYPHTKQEYEGKRKCFLSWNLHTPA